MKTLPQPGTYTARRNAAIVVEEAESGALMAWIAYILCSGDFAYQDKHSVCLGAKDGTVQTRSIETLKKIWPDFDPANPFSLEQLPLLQESEEGYGAPEFELANCYHDNSYIPAGKTEPIIQFRAQYLNPLGGTQNMPAPLDDGEKKKVLGKWGAKFKAAAGSGAAKPAQKPAAKAASAPAQQQELPAAKPAAAKPAVGGPPSRKAATTARISTAEKVWTDFYNKRGGTDETSDALGDEFYAAQDQVAPGSNGELTPEQWGQVADKLGV